MAGQRRGAPAIRLGVAGPADNDPGRLWWHVVCAVQRVCPGFGAEDVLGTLRVQVPEFTGTVLPCLVNALAALAGPVVLVLDDYHVITERACHQQLNFLLAHLPPSVQLVLTSRTNPPLRLGRLRAAGQLLDIRADQLRLATAHVAALVDAVSGVQLNGPDLADLGARTEGWPPACTWPRCRCAAIRRRTSSSASSPGTTGSSVTSWPKRCSPGSHRRSSSS